MKLLLRIFYASYRFSTVYRYVKFEISVNTVNFILYTLGIEATYTLYLWYRVYVIQKNNKSVMVDIEI